MNKGIILNAGDPVYYTGTKFKQELTTKDGKPFEGWIHSRVQGTDNKFVVEFPEAKEPDYVMTVDVLKWRHIKRKAEAVGPEVHRRKRGGEEEV
jgi:hypothetical protein